MTSVNSVFDVPLLLALVCFISVQLIATHYLQKIPDNRNVRLQIAIQVGIVLVTSLSISGLYSVINYQRAQYMYEDLLGTWAYESETGNFGIANIHFENSKLHYYVDVYHKVEHVKAALRGESVAGAVVAKAKSYLIEYQDNTLVLAYSLESRNGEDIYPDRKGILKLNMLAGKRKNYMEGMWYSTKEKPDKDVDHNEVCPHKQRGWLHLMRPELFLEKAFKNRGCRASKNK